MVEGSRVYAGTSTGVFVSSDSGAHWMDASSGLTTANISTFASRGANLFAGTAGGVFLSTDNGSTWNDASGGLTGLDVRSLAVKGLHLFAGTAGGGAFYSSDDGTTWSAVNSGLAVDTVLALLPSGTNLFAGTPNASVWRRPLSEIITSVQPPTGQAPVAFSLGQNYPNPFNPTTSITYATPARTFITIKVFDVLGREVATLVNGMRSPGEYEARWNADGMPSGVYLCRLEADQYTRVRRMLLVR
jgi:hypothetical protein